MVVPYLLGWRYGLKKKYIKYVNFVKFMEQMQVDFIKLLAWAYRNMRKNMVIELLGRQL